MLQECLQVFINSNFLFAKRPCIFILSEPPVLAPMLRQQRGLNISLTVQLTQVHIEDIQEHHSCLLKIVSSSVRPVPTALKLIKFLFQDRTHIAYYAV